MRDHGRFLKGHKAPHHLPIGSINIRFIRQTGKERAYIKIGEPSIWKVRARYMWEQRYGKIPRGMIIYHKDGDTLNDNVGNLELISRARHLEIYRTEFRNKRLRKSSVATRKRWIQYRRDLRRGKCNCGELADVRIPIYQLRPNGRGFMNCMRLCNDCNILEQELNKEPEAA